MFGSFGGWKLDHLLTACGLTKDQVIFCDQVAYRYGYSQAELAAFYTAMDVYLAISYGEGFGVGTIEAQACGTPVIVRTFARVLSCAVMVGWLSASRCGMSRKSLGLACLTFRRLWRR
jgi:glycosyltransferase involved in cell wall biosynthesis